MDLGSAQLLATMSDPKGVAGMLKHSSDPAAAKAVAQQFGSLLMQGLMQQNDGSAIGMVDGTGGGIVNSMFASTIAQTAMKGEKLGLTDLLLRSIEKKQQQGVAGGTGKTTAPAAAGGVAVAAAASGAGLPLAAYWQGHGMRPLAVAAAAAAASGSIHAAPSPIPGAGIALSPYARMAALVLPPAGAAPQAAAAAPPGQSGGGTADPAIAAFTAQVAPLVQKAARQLGVSPRILLAQAAIETGWGRSVVGNNLFGIKAGAAWSGPRVTAPTHEYENGNYVAISDSFRAYPSYEASVQDFVAMVSGSPRYQAALGKGEDANGYGQALLSGGWATDVDYVRKLAAVAGGTHATAPFAAPAAPGEPVPLVPRNFATMPL